MRPLAIILLAIATFGLAACNSSNDPASASDGADDTPCGNVRQYVPALADELNRLQNSTGHVQSVLDDLADTLMDIHVALADTAWDDLAQQAREDVASVDAVPLGNGAESRFERTRWGLGPAILHDQIVDRCSAPARDDASERRDRFLESTD